MVDGTLPLPCTPDPHLAAGLVVAVACMHGTIAIAFLVASWKPGGPREKLDVTTRWRYEREQSGVSG